MTRTTGSKLWVGGDPGPFVVCDPPDVVVAALEAADHDAFVALRSEWEHDVTHDVVMRTMYVRPSSVYAVAPALNDEDDEP